MPQRYAKVLRDYDTQPVELFIGLIATVWGVWLLLPLQALSLSPAARVLLLVARPQLWAILMLCVGLVQITGAVRGGSHRRLAALIAMLWWCWLATTFGLSNWHATGLPILTVYFLAELWIAFRLF